MGNANDAGVTPDAGAPAPPAPAPAPAAPAPAPAPAQAPGPAAACAHPGNARTVDLQPVFFKNNGRDEAPTGHTWRRRLPPVRTIWGKLGVQINALAPIVRIDPDRKIEGDDQAEVNDVAGAADGAGIEIFFVDNNLTWTGGGRTIPPLGADAKIVVADHGTNNNLIAHELGHVLGVMHPGAPHGGEANTVMQPSGSQDATNPSRNTMTNYNLITWPPPGDATCLHPDT